MLAANVVVPDGPAYDAIAYLGPLVETAPTANGNDEPRFEKIIGGGPAEPGAYPWVVSLEDRSGAPFCGGTLIAPNKVLSAAHCVDREQASDLWAVIGRYDRSTNDGERIQVERIQIFPQFDAPSLDSDIAVIDLSTDATAAHPIAYASADETQFYEPGTYATVLGWGETDSGDKPNRLYEVVVPIVETESVNGPDGYDGKILPTMLAAGSTGMDACQGDSGGPLVVPDGGMGFVLVGIVSWGLGCGVEGRPGIYTRVSQFTDFIESPETFITPNDDHGNRADDATAAHNGRHPGVLEASSDIDWFSFPAEQGKPVICETSLGTLIDSQLTLYDSNGTSILAEDDNSGNGLASKLEWTPSVTGTYFISVASAGFRGGTYDLSISGAHVKTIFDGDVNRDGTVDARDLNILAIHWRAQSTTLTWFDGDLNGDGTVDAEDLNRIGRTWQSNQAMERRYRRARFPRHVKGIGSSRSWQGEETPVKGSDAWLVSGQRRRPFVSLRVVDQAIAELSDASRPSE